MKQANDAKAEAVRAKSEARTAKAALAAARKQIARNKGNVDQAKQDLAAANVKIESVIGATHVATVTTNSDTSARGQTTMGSQLSRSAVMVNTTPKWFAEASVGAVFIGDDGHGVAIHDADGRTEATGISGEMSHASQDAVGVEITGAVGSRDPNGTEFRASFAYLKVDGSETCTVTGADDICIAANHPVNSDVDDTDLDEVGDTAQGSLKVQRGVVDLEIGRGLSLGHGLALTLSSGARVAWIEHDFDQALTETDGAGTITDSFDREQSNKFRGVGGKLAANLRWNWGNLSVKSGAAGSLLVASREYRIAEVDDLRTPNEDPDRRDLLNFSSDETIVIPVLEAQAELAWNFRTGNNPAFVALGYRYQSWLDVTRSYMAIDDVDDNTVLDKTHDLTFHGPYVRAGIAWGGSEALK